MKQVTFELTDENEKLMNYLRKQAGNRKTIKEVLNNAITEGGLVLLEKHEKVEKLMSN